MGTAHALRSVITLFFTLLAWHAGQALAQDYPSKPIRCIVPFSAGGGTDSIARLVGSKITEAWGRPFIVENKPGADGRIATELAAKAAPDGYTILLVSNLHSISASVFSKLPYDPVKSFAPITLAARSPELLVVHPSVPAKTLKELVELAKAKPGKLSYGTSGLAQTGHVSGELLKSMAGIDMLHVPYKGTAEAVIAVLGGHVDAAFASVASALPHVKAGTLRALAITTATRSDVVPDVPTFIESGYPGFVTATWYGFLAPAGTPQPIVHKLNAEIVRILQLPDVREKLLASGLEPSPMSAEEFDKFIRSEIVRFGKVVKDAGIRIE